MASDTTTPIGSLPHNIGPGIGIYDFDAGVKGGSGEGVSYMENMFPDIPAPNLPGKDIFDPVNKPLHYNCGAVECIDAIESSMEPNEFRSYCKGNIIKYIWRYEHKNGLEDLKKAQWYLNRMIASYEKEMGVYKDE